MPDAPNRFEKAGQGVAPGLVSELWAFLYVNKKWWLLPIFVVVLLATALVPIIRRNTAAMAVCGRIAQLPAKETARESPLRIGTTFCASLVAERMRSSKSAEGSTMGSATRRRVARIPLSIDAQRAHPPTWRFTAALVTSSSSS